MNSSDVFTNLLHEFFSVWKVEKNIHWTKLYISLFANWIRNHNKYSWIQNSLFSGFIPWALVLSESFKLSQLGESTMFIRKLLEVNSRFNFFLIFLESEQKLLTFLQQLISKKKSVHLNGILFPKLFRPIGRKKYSSDFGEIFWNSTLKAANYWDQK